MKKRFNENCILFAFAALFICMGLFGQSLIKVASGTIHMFVAIGHFDNDGVALAKADIEKSSSDQLRYHDMMMNVDSIRNNILGIKVIYKDDTTIVKTDSESLIEISPPKSASELDEIVGCIEKLKHVSENNGASFLYCAIPSKNNYVTTPSNVMDFTEDNYNEYVKKIYDADIPILDLSSIMTDKKDTDIYFSTDHHWKPQYGLKASGAICEELYDRYGFSYNKEYIDIQNYNIKTLPDYFLGSWGKKVGAYFSWNGADDFDLITPKFETSLAFEEPLIEKKREGAFEETVLFMSNVEEKNLYNKSPYATYCDGDCRLQIIKNHLKLDGKKIVIVRDSFACVVTPYLSLQTNELHCCDMRDFISGEKINMAEYISETSPDYVIVIFSGVPTPGKGGRVDFF